MSSKFIPHNENAEKNVISIRIDANLVEKLDEIAAKYDLSRNQLINQSIIFALEHLEEM